jgi:hypothetical protein
MIKFLHGKRLSRLLAATALAVTCAYPARAAVTLTQGTITYNHPAVNLNPDHTLGSGGASVPNTLPTLVLENEYVRVKVVPSYGARIISLYYKPSAHEELWADPNAVVMSMNSFFYNWLMVWGGIFPAWGSPEHGKFWFLPWDYSIVKQTADTVSVAMYMTDSIPWRQGYSTLHSAYGATGIKCTFTVTLVSGMTGIGVDVTLVNPGSASTGTEYWTCTTVSPGSAPANLTLTDGAQMIMPCDTVIINPGYNGLRGQETPVTGDWFLFNKLRWWKNWVEQGILYAYPQSNLWGIMNHDGNQESIMRVCDNKATLSCKIWTCGRNGLPYWEPWAGISDQFYHKATFAAGETKAWHEFYTPTLGIDSVSHASDDALANLKTAKSRYDGNADDSVRVTAQVFLTRPARQVHASLTLDGGGVSQSLYDTSVSPDSLKGNGVKVSIACKQVYNSATALTLKITDLQTKVLLNAVKPLTFVNCAQTGVVQRPFAAIAAGAVGPDVSLYTVTGKFVCRAKDGADFSRMALAPGSYVVRYANGILKRCTMDARR